MYKRKMTISYATGDNSRGHQKPMIRITNRYLLSSGFHVGDAIDVFYGNEHITITKTNSLLNNIKSRDNKNSRW